MLVLVVFVEAAGGQLARAGVIGAKPMRIGPAGQVVLRSSFRKIRTDVGATFASGDYLVSTHAGAGDEARYGIVVNDRLGTTVRLDPRCDVEALGPPWVVMTCPPHGDQELYSLVDGTRRTVTPNPSWCPPTPSGSGCGAAAVGSYWIEWYLSSYHYPTTFHFQNLQTGEFRDDPTNATTFPDLNSPSLAQTTCPGVRLIRRNTEGRYDNPWGGLTYEGQFALAMTNGLPGRVFLERCGTRMRRLLPNGWSECCTGSVIASNASVIVWQSAVNRLSGLFLPSLQKFTIPLPSAMVAWQVREGGTLAPALTSDMLYVTEGGGALLRTASPAALPRNVSGPRVTHSRSALTCARGSWLNAARFSYEWRVNGRKENTRKSRLVLAKSPTRRSVNCSVIASNPTGSTTASSAPLYLR